MMCMTYVQSIERADAFEYLERNGFPDHIPTGGPTADVSAPVFRSWRFMRLRKEGIVFSNGMVPHITADDYECFVYGDL